MAVLRWDPWGDVAALQRDMNQLLQRTANGGTREVSAVPPIDAFRTEEALVVRIDLPGMNPDAVDVSVQEGVLTIHGERPLDADVPEDSWVRRERPVGEFERSFTLPEGTQADSIEATFEHGVLELRIPHPPQHKPRRIEIRPGGQQRTVEVGGGS